MKRVDPDTIDLFVNPEMVAERLRIFKKITQNHITNLIGIQKPEIYADFPDDFPSELEFSNYRPKDQPKSSKKTLESSLKEDVKYLIGDAEIQKQRQSRYKGHYKIDETQKQMFNQEPPARKASRRIISTSSAGSKSSVSSKGSLEKNSKTSKVRLVETIAISSEDSDSSESDSDSSNGEVRPSTSAMSGIAQFSSSKAHPPKQALKKVKKSTRTLSSSSESEVEEAPKSSTPSIQHQKQTAFETPSAIVMPPVTNEAPKKRSRSLSLSSSDDDDENQKKKKVAKATFKTPEAPVVLQKKTITLPELTKGNVEKVQQDKSNQKPAKNYKVPPVIEPPLVSLLYLVMKTCKLKFYFDRFTQELKNRLQRNQP